MATRVVVLGAGFGGLELTTLLSEEFAGAIDIVLIDKADAFVFGFSKLEVMFGHQAPAAIHHPYRDLVKPGVRFLQSTVRSIDPAGRRVVTDAGPFEADVLVVALGADLDPAATPGLVEGGHEFYTVEGAIALRDVLSRFEGGPVIVGVTGKSFKCPPAPSETALLLHDYLSERGVRGAADISLVMPFGTPVPPSPDTSQALLTAFADRGIRFVKDNLVTALDSARKVAVLSDGTELPVRPLPRHTRPPRAAGGRRVWSRRLTSTTGCRSTSRRLPPGFLASTRSATSMASGHRRRACSRRAPPESSRPPSLRSFAAGRRRRRTRARARATSSSATARSGVSTWTSSPGRSRPAPSRRRQRRSWPRRKHSDPAGLRAGSAFQARRDSAKRSGRGYVYLVAPWTARFAASRDCARSMTSRYAT